MDSQSPCQQSLGMSRECFRLVSEREKEIVVVGRQATAHIVSCDSAESYLHFLHSSDTSCPIDAGPTVMCLVHGQELVDSLKPALLHGDLCLGRRKPRSQLTNMGAAAQAVGRDPSFSTPEGLTGDCTLRAR